MVDFLYSVITRPIANEPDKKDKYAIPPAYKDGKAMEVSDEEPNKKGQQESEKKDQEAKSKDDSPKESQKGKGIYQDAEGRRHLDIYA